MGYFRKRNKRETGAMGWRGGSWGHTFLKSLFPGIFRSFYHPKKHHKLFLSRPLEILRPKTKTLGNSISLITSENFTLFLGNPWKFLLLFPECPGEFHILYPPIFIFGIVQWRNALIPHYMFHSRPECSMRVYRVSKVSF